MTTVAVTGASGHLGRILVPYLWERGHVVAQVGREMPSPDAEVVIHLAAPDWRDLEGIRDFAAYNEHLARFSEVNSTRVISAGSWWQYADGDAPALPYSRMKSDQMCMFDCTVVLFSVYGDRPRDGHGFIPALLAAAARGAEGLPAASHEPRDWIYATDACGALRAALSAPDGIYEAATGQHYSPAELARSVLGVDLPDHPADPSCAPRHRHTPVPGWAPRTDVLDFLRRRTAAA